MRDAQTLVQKYKSMNPDVMGMDDMTTLAMIKSKYPGIYDDVVPGSVPNSNTLLDKAQQNLPTVQHTGTYNPSGIEQFAQKIPNWAVAPMAKWSEGLGDIYGPATELANQATFGWLRPAMRSANIELPQATTLPGKVQQGIGGLFGMIEGGPGAVYQGAERLAARYMPKALAQATAGSTAALYGTGSAEDRTKQGVVGAVGAPAMSFLAGKVPAGLDRLKGYFSKGSIPQRLEETGSQIADLVSGGREKVMGAAKSKYATKSKQFERILTSSKARVSGSDMATPLRATATELGEGTPHNKYLMEIADQISGQENFMTPIEMQNLYQRIAQDLVNINEASHLGPKAATLWNRNYSGFLRTTGKDLPRIQKAREGISRYIENIKTAKKIKAKDVERASRGSVGPKGQSGARYMGEEELAERQAELAGIPGAPDIFGEASQLGMTHRQLLKQLSDIERRQNIAKVGVAGGGLAYLIKQMVGEGFGNIVDALKGS